MSGFIFTQSPSSILSTNQPRLPEIPLNLLRIHLAMSYSKRYALFARNYQLPPRNPQRVTRTPTSYLKHHISRHPNALEIKTLCSDPVSAIFNDVIHLPVGTFLV